MPSEPDFAAILLRGEKRASRKPSRHNYDTQDNVTLEAEAAFDYAPYLVWELRLRVPSGATSDALFRFARRLEKEFRVRAGSDPFKLTPEGTLGSEFRIRPVGADTTIDLFVTLRRG